MRVATHFFFGTAVGIAFAPDIYAVTASALGALVPDKLDSVIAGQNRLKWQRIHRTWSHNLGYWLLPVLLWLWFYPYDFTGWKFAAYNTALFFYIGILSHLLLDFLNPMGIGLLPLASNARLGLRLIKTNSFGDRFLGLLSLGGAIVWRVYTGLNFREFFFPLTG